MAVVFPFVMLAQMFSSGAMGGGVSSAVSCAIGAGDLVRARSSATHAVVIGGNAGLLSTALFLLAGPVLYRWLGLDQESIWNCRPRICIDTLARGIHPYGAPAG